VSLRGVRLSDRVFLVAQTGKGKSTFALWLIDQLWPVRTIVFDPKGEFDFGFPPARTPAELRAQMHQPIVHYVPASFDRESLEEACQIVWRTPGPYVWLIDEGAEVTNPNYCPQGLRLGVTQGRRFKKCVIFLTQRVAETHPVFRSQAEHVIVFTPTPIALDLKEIAKAVRREPAVLEAELVSLHSEHGDFSHLWYVRPTDELRRCAPIPLEAFTGAPGLAAADPGQQRATPVAASDEASQSPPCDSSDSASGAFSRSD